MYNSHLRHTIAGVVVILYLFPVLLVGLLLTFYPEYSFLLVSVGILSASLGSIIMIVKMWQWESGLLEQIDVLAHSKADYDARLYMPQDGLPEPIVRESGKEAARDQELDLLLQQIRRLEETGVDLQNRAEEQQKQCALEAEQKQNLSRQLEHLEEELEFFKESSRGQLKQKDDLLLEYQTTINDLRSSMEKKQLQIGKLEGSVNELTYEIKTLMQVNDQEVEVASMAIGSAPASRRTVRQTAAPRLRSEGASARQPRGSVEPVAVQTTLPFVEKNTPLQKSASIQLKRCIDIAQKMTGAGHIGMSSRFRDVPIDSYALDQRRLFDNLRAESTNLIFVYSQREEKLLFANSVVKTMLGWSSDKFIQDFPRLVQEGFEDWRKAVSSIAMTREAQVPLVIKTRGGQDLFIQCQMGIVPSGVFKNHLLGILFEP